MPNFILRTTLLLLSILTLSALHAQSVERNSYAVFSPIAPNDTLLLAGGQIMTGESESPLINHGYYPLNYTLLTINENELTDAYSIYPNPFSNAFLITWTNPEFLVITVEVYSVNGALLERINTSESHIEILAEKWASGLYYVRGITTQGTVFNEKLIKA